MYSEIRDIQLIYQSCLPRLKRYVLSRGGQLCDVEDIFHDAILALYGNGPIAVQKSLDAYFMGICRNLWVKSIISRKCLVTFDQGLSRYDIVDIEEAFIAAEYKHLFWEKFFELGEDKRDILGLYFAGKSMKQIARELKLSSAAYAKKKKHLAQRRLIQLIKLDSRYNELRSD